MPLSSFEKEREGILSVVKRFHRARHRFGGKEPDWHHVDRVSRLLQIVLNESREGKPTERRSIMLAGLGHDLLEDTNITTEEVLRLFGSRGHILVERMTNRLGDKHTEPYVRQLAQAPETVKLIKLADLYDNCSSVTYQFQLLGARWTKTFFLPTVNPMIDAMLAVRFQSFPIAGRRLQEMVSYAHQSLLYTLDRHQRSS